MTSLTLDIASSKDLEKWDTLIAQSYNGTLFHRRDFLSYHADKFVGLDHFLVFRKGETIKALLSVALDKENKHIARSPYGASYGGIVFMEEPSYSFSISIITELKKWLKTNEIHDFTMTLPIDICNANRTDTFQFTLIEQGFASISRNISSVVELNNPDTDIINRITKNARNMARKALNNGLIIEHDCPVQDFYPVLLDTYDKYGANPTHTFKELEHLNAMFTNDVRCHIATHNGKPVAGLCEFKINNLVNSAFYFCQIRAYEKLQGLSLLVYDALDRAEKNGYKYYDFGLSTTKMVANPNIFRFKESYNAFGVFRETFQWVQQG